MRNKKQSIPKEFLGAFKAGHRPSAREFIDESLAWQLLKKWQKSKGTDKESYDALVYLTKFNNEYHKNVIPKDNTALHNTPELKKQLYDRENARNRDIMSVKKDSIISTEYKANYTDKEPFGNSEGYTKYHPDYNNRDLFNHENTLIEILDLEKQSDNT